MTAVFLSYEVTNERDANLVERVLIKYGITVTSGMAVPAGANVSKSVLNEMQSVDAFVFLISKQFAKSQWTQIEVAAATAKFTRGEGKLLIPVLLGQDLDPAEDVPPLLARFAWLDLREEGVTEKSLAPLVNVLSDPATQEPVADQLQAEREILLLRQQVDEQRATRVTMELRAAMEHASLRKTRTAFVWGVSAALLGGIAAALAVFVTRGGDAHEHSIGVALVVSLAGNFLALLLPVASSLTSTLGRSSAQTAKRGVDDRPH